MNKIINRLTNNAKSSIRQSQKLSGENNLKKVDAIYLLQALLEQTGSLGENIAKTNFKNFSQISTNEKKGAKKFFTRVSVHEVIIRAFKLALASKNPYVGTEHLAHGLLSIASLNNSRTANPASDLENSHNNFPSSFFDNKNPSFSDFFGEMNMLIDNFMAPGKQKTKKNSFIDTYCSNLNSLVNKRDNLLIGRKDELDRISNILGRKIKNNPVLVGDPGVGKTAIVEGLALEINLGRAPFYLCNKKIVSLDMGSLIAGTTFRGEFEARLKEIISEAKSNKDIILFIDEIHNLVGAGNAVGGLDAANLLKPALSRGEIQVIGATTFDEYRKHIEKDSALERRFQPVIINEPSIEETVQILEGIKKSYESYHNISISKSALLQASILAKRYLGERFLPDSAIDLIDETSARIRSKVTDLKLFGQIRELQQKLERIIRDKETLVINDRFEDAIRLRDLEKRTEKELSILKNQQKKIEQQNPIQLDEKDIRQTVSQISQIPLSLLSGQKDEIVTNIKNSMQKNLIGQKEASVKIQQTILRQFSGIGNPNRPLGSFLFIGPTGVGKTLTAKLLSQSIAPGKTDSLIQINMSEFMERHTVSRLLGAPAGYVGYDDSGELAEKVRRNPYSVVLFDEIEKADPSVLNILLQILEEGIISDSKGRTVNFKNSIVILTSNIGTAELNLVSKLGFQEDKKKAEDKEAQIKKEIMEELSDQLPLELINRLDNILIFNSLGKADIEKIVNNELESLGQRLSSRNFSFSFEPEVIRLIAKRSLSPEQGARQVRKQIEGTIEPLIADKIIRNKKLKKIQLVVKNKMIRVK